MAVNQSVVDAYIRIYTSEQLETALSQALSDFTSGVQITQVSFEGGNASGQRISGSPTMLIEHLEEALKQITTTTRAGAADSAFIDLSKRTWGT